ncbi:MAG: KH domain-containing protein [Anaerolineales bacterium]|nr:KH domain-containing protein [Anaerolineales bacterium]
MSEALALEPSETELATARATLEELLAKMKITATVTAGWSKPDEDGVHAVLLDVRGDDLSVLIGRRGETLNALQHLTRQLVSKKLNKGLNVVIDVENYRQRRREQLRRMARRTAEQVVERRRPIALEPMPPDERRLIHLELRDHPHVRTESVGEEPKRQVTIFPK